MESMLATFDLQVTLMLPTKFQVNWPFGSGKEAKNRFSRWPSWRSSLAFQIESILAILIYKSPACFYQVSSQLTFRSRRRSKKYISKMAAAAAVLDFRSERF